MEPPPTFGEKSFQHNRFHQLKRSAGNEFDFLKTKWRSGQRHLQTAAKQHFQNLLYHREDDFEVTNLSVILHEVLPNLNVHDEFGSMITMSKLNPVNNNRGNKNVTTFDTSSKLEQEDKEEEEEEIVFDDSIWSENDYRIEMVTEPMRNWEQNVKECARKSLDNAKQSLHQVIRDKVQPRAARIKVQTGKNARRILSNLDQTVKTRLRLPQLLVQPSKKYLENIRDQLQKVKHTLHSIAAPFIHHQLTALQQQVSHLSWTTEWKLHFQQVKMHLNQHEPDFIISHHLQTVLLALPLLDSNDLASNQMVLSMARHAAQYQPSPSSPAPIFQKIVDHEQRQRLKNNVSTVQWDDDDDDHTDSIDFDFVHGARTVQTPSAVPRSIPQFSPKKPALRYRNNTKTNSAAAAGANESISSRGCEPSYYARVAERSSAIVLITVLLHTVWRLKKDVQRTKQALRRSNNKHVGFANVVGTHVISPRLPEGQRDRDRDSPETTHTVSTHEGGSVTPLQSPEQSKERLLTEMLQQKEAECKKLMNQLELVQQELAKHDLEQPDFSKKASLDFDQVHLNKLEELNDELQKLVEGKDLQLLNFSTQVQQLTKDLG